MTAFLKCQGNILDFHQCRDNHFITIFKESNSFGEIFGGSTLRPGDTYEFTFTNAGTFGYHGVPHSWNKGKVTVLQP